MVSIASLWLAILLSAVAVWIVSAIVWMVLPHHKKDFHALPDEAGAIAALKNQNLQPGRYNFPHLHSPAQLKEEENRRKFEEGPAGYLTVLPRGVPSMGRSMAIQFVTYLIVGGIVAYVATRTLPAGADYLKVFQVTGTVAFVAYGVGSVQDAIWFGRPWSDVGKNLFDAFLYGNFTGGVFGWLWPSVVV